MSGFAAAQTPRQLPTFELEHLTFNPSQHAGLLIGTGDLLPERHLRASLIAHYEHDPLVYLFDGNRVGAVVRSRVTAHLMAAYGITRWLEVGLQLPIVAYQHGEAVPEIAGPTVAAVGTPWLQARFGLLSQAKGQPIDLAIQLSLGLPIGNSAAFTRDGSVGFSPRVGVGRSFGPLRAGLEVAALIRKKTRLSPDSTVVYDEVGSSMQVGAMVSTTRPGLRGELALLGWFSFAQSPSSVELLGAVRYPIGPIEVFALGGPGFGHTPGTPAFRAMLGVSLSLPSVHACVEPYEPKDCPELDLDHDGVLNADDSCPSEPGPAQLGGCAVKDADGDGISDADDSCPNLAGPKEHRGCPPSDSDGDGELDADDACPKIAGSKENKGCPWPDTDSDTVLDKDDACPQVPGPVELKGCPILDSDNDSVPDELDNCPKVKGLPENQGCPKEQEQLVVITRENLVIKERIFFDTNKAVIKPRSYPLLTQVAKILVAHPEIAHLVIQGHTDNVGDAASNRKLSLRRAEAVRDFLMKNEVEGVRLEAQGFGPDRPAFPNDTAAGRDSNRRVEFAVTTQEKIQINKVAP